MAKLCPKCYGEHEIGIICPGRPKARPTIAEVREKISETGVKPKVAARIAREPAVPTRSPAETAQPPRAKPALARKPLTIEQMATYEHAANKELAKGNPPPLFDRQTYQRLYMKDKRAADRLGLTVAEYRKQHANE